MRSFRRLRLALGVLTLGFLFLPDAATGQAPPAASKRYTIDTVDGVKLKANLFVGKGKDAPIVILIHNFDKTGGDSQKDGWNELAKALQKEGHNVLSFDFRGHGESTVIDDPKKFWGEFAYNQKYLKSFRGSGGKLPETLTHTDFLPAYYPLLVNDLTAVRAFLDRQNDSGELNTSNVIVIGAGQGATLGALWMASEFKRRQAVPLNPLLPFQAQLTLLPGQYDLKDPAGKDFAAGIFLTPATTLGGFPVPVHTWLKEIGKDNKLPLAFIYGTEDKASTKQALDTVVSISPKYKVGAQPPMDLPFTGEKGVETKLGGSQLLAPELPTQKWIVKDYIPPLLEKRTLQEPRTQGFDKSIAFWVISPLNRVPVRTNEIDRSPRPLPLVNFGVNR